MPDPAGWPGVPCALCGRDAVGFFGKQDVALAESESYRNSTPRGHAGMALCWPCLVSFHALPYGSQLTGGPSVALHSWDEGFLRSAVGRQVARNRQIAEVGARPAGYAREREVVAIKALRHYSARLIAGVDLLVYSNNNRGQLLEPHSLEQPLAEWLRRTLREPGRRRGFAVLLRAHRSGSTAGVVALARNAFRDPVLILGTGLGFLAGILAGPDPDRGEVADLADLLLSLVTEVMGMDEKDLAELRAAASNIALLLKEETSGGRLRQFAAYQREPRRLRTWLTSRGVQWAIAPPDGATGPLVSERAFDLLFDPGPDNQAWFHRNVLLVAVLQELSRLGWRSSDPDEKSTTIEELADIDRQFVGDEGEEEQ